MDTYIMLFYIIIQSYNRSEKISFSAWSLKFTEYFRPSFIFKMSVDIFRSLISFS